MNVLEAPLMGVIRDRRKKMWLRQAFPITPSITVVIERDDKVKDYFT